MDRTPRDGAAPVAGESCPCAGVLVHCSAVDALSVAIAEPRGTVLTGDRADSEALAAHADHVNVEVI